MLNTELSDSMSTWKAILSYIIVALFLFFEMAVQVSPSVMTSALMRDMSIGAFGLGLMSGFYFYTYTGMQIPSGLLFDRFQPRYVITASILTCCLGCLLFGLSDNIYLGVVARLLMGFGSASAFVAVLVVTADLFAHRHFALITGITQMLAAFGAMSGQMPLSVAITHLGWRATMFMLAAVGFLLALFVWSVLNYKKDILPLKQQPSKNTTTRYGFSDIVFNKQSWIIAAYACLLWAPMSGFGSLWGVPFLQHVYGISKSSAALICSIMWLGLALVSPFLGWLSTAMRSRVWPLAISSLVGALAFAAILGLHLHSLWLIGALMFCCGAACTGQALSFSVVKEINPKFLQATAIAFNNMAVVISGAIFQPLLGRLLDFHCSGIAGNMASCEARHYRLSMLILLAAYVGSFVLATFLMKESFGRPQRKLIT